MRTPFSSLTLLCFLMSSIIGPMPVYAADDFLLPQPGTMVYLSPKYNPPVFRGITVYPDNPFKFDFILDKGDNSVSSMNGNKNLSSPNALVGDLQQEQLKQESTKLVKYFLASITTPENDLWVNLSPYEKNRIIPESFGQTDMGRDLLAEDYILKQITASLIYPEKEIGKQFWKRVYQEAQKKFGTTNISVNTFNKVWIVPNHAKVYEHGNTAFVIKATLKVMLEQDYLSFQKHNVETPFMASNNKDAINRVSTKNDINSLGSQVVREIIIPELEKEVNEGKNFAVLRQVYNSLILAMWFKKRMKDSILGQKYMDQNKVSGIHYNNSVILSKAKDLINKTKDFSALPQNDIEGIYQRYLKAFKRGVYNYIKDEPDPLTQEMIPRKYFSGGIDAKDLAQRTDLSKKVTLKEIVLSDAAEITVSLGRIKSLNTFSEDDDLNQAMNQSDEPKPRLDVDYKNLTPERFIEALSYYSGSEEAVKFVPEHFIGWSLADLFQRYDREECLFVIDDDIMDKLMNKIGRKRIKGFQRSGFIFFRKSIFDKYKQRDHLARWVIDHERAHVEYPDFIPTTVEGYIRNELFALFAGTYKTDGIAAFQRPFIYEDQTFHSFKEFVIHELKTHTFPMLSQDNHDLVFINDNLGKIVDVYVHEMSKSDQEARMFIDFLKIISSFHDILGVGQLYLPNPSNNSGIQGFNDNLRSSHDFFYNQFRVWWMSNRASSQTASHAMNSNSSQAMTANEELLEDAKDVLRRGFGEPNYEFTKDELDYDMKFGVAVISKSILDKYNAIWQNNENAIYSQRFVFILKDTLQRAYGEDKEALEYIAELKQKEAELKDVADLSDFDHQIKLEVELVNEGRSTLDLVKANAHSPRKSVSFKAQAALLLLFDGPYAVPIDVDKVQRFVSYALEQRNGVARYVLIELLKKGEPVTRELMNKSAFLLNKDQLEAVDILMAGLKEKYQPEIQDIYVAQHVSSNDVRALIWLAQTGNHQALGFLKEIVGGKYSPNREDRILALNAIITIVQSTKSKELLEWLLTGVMAKFDIKDYPFPSGSFDDLIKQVLEDNTIGPEIKSYVLALTDLNDERLKIYAKEIFTKYRDKPTNRILGDEDIWLNETVKILYISVLSRIRSIKNEDSESLLDVETANALGKEIMTKHLLKEEYEGVMDGKFIMGRLSVIDYFSTMGQLMAAMAHEIGHDFYEGQRAVEEFIADRVMFAFLEELNDLELIDQIRKHLNYYHEESLAKQESFKTAGDYEAARTLSEEMFKFFENQLAHGNHVPTQRQILIDVLNFLKGEKNYRTQDRWKKAIEFALNKDLVSIFQRLEAYLRNKYGASIKEVELIEAKKGEMLLSRWHPTQTHQKAATPAMTSLLGRINQEKKGLGPGGIDLTSKRMNLEVDKDKGMMVSQKFNLKSLENIEINGLYIKDIEIKPINNLQKLLAVQG